MHVFSTRDLVVARIWEEEMYNLVKRFVVASVYFTHDLVKPSDEMHELSCIGQTKSGINIRYDQTNRCSRYNHPQWPYEHTGRDWRVSEESSMSDQKRIR